MVERRSNLHNPRIDEQMEHEVDSVTSGDPVEARAEDERLMEDAGDGEPTVQPLVHAGDEEDGLGSALSRTEVRERSELARHLRGSIFPANRSAILACAVEEHAPPQLIDALQQLPDGEYANVEAVWEGLGGRREERSHDELPAEPPDEPPDESIEPARQRRFGFRFDTRFRVAAAPFFVHPDSAWVVVDPKDGGTFLARFGPWVVRTPLANLAGAAVTGPYSTWKTIGPAHLSLADRGLTFATNRDRGVCIRFFEAVSGMDPMGVVRHPGLTVTVEDVDGLVGTLADAGVPVVSG